MLWGAHIAGIPVEETALSFAPVLAATGGIAGVKLRARLTRRRMRQRRRVSPDGRRR
ncbi:MAG TPA: hypothetical protein VJL81_16890 [Solirubrobacterales bacterium]|nr:hypothetical protein [Solirubrobacterales bacterium]